MQNKRKITSFDILTVLLFLWLRVLWVTSAARAYDWLTFNLLLSRTTVRAAPQPVSSLYNWKRLLLPSCRTLHLFLLVFIKFPMIHSCSQSRVLWMDALPLSIICCISVCCHSTNKTDVFSVSSTPLKKILNWVGPKTEMIQDRMKHSSYKQPDLTLTLALQWEGNWIRSPEILLILMILWF